MGNTNKATQLVFAVSPDVWYQGDIVSTNRQQTLYLEPVLMCGIRLQRYATGSLMALFRLDMLILKRMQLASPAGVPATISFQTARLSSAGLLRCLDSIPSMRSCRSQSVRKAKKAKKGKGREGKGRGGKGREGEGRGGEGRGGEGREGRGGEGRGGEGREGKVHAFQ